MLTRFIEDALVNTIFDCFAVIPIHEKDDLAEVVHTERFEFDVQSFVPSGTALIQMSRRRCCSTDQPLYYRWRADLEDDRWST